MLVNHDELYPPWPRRRFIGYAAAMLELSRRGPRTRLSAGVPARHERPNRNTETRSMILPTHAFRPSVLVVLLAAFASGAAAQAPQPSPVPVRWEFDLQIEQHLGIELVETPDLGRRPYFYMTYRVTNFTESDRLLAPLWELVTEEGDVMRSGRGVPASVTDTLMERMNNPLLQDQFSMVSTQLRGIENTRFGLVVWPADDLDTDTVTVFATGFSGENTAYFTSDPETGERVRHLLRKTRMLRYSTPGLLSGTRGRSFELIEDRWTMR